MPKLSVRLEIGSCYESQDIHTRFSQKFLEKMATGEFY